MRCIMLIHEPTETARNPRNPTGAYGKILAEETYCRTHGTHDVDHDQKYLFIYLYAILCVQYA